LLKKTILSLSVVLFAVFAAFSPTADAWSASKADAILRTGNKYLGTPYEFGAKYGQTRTFDCSSFVKYVYAQNGIDLPRTSRQQAKVGKTVTLGQLRKGDLVFFKSAGSSSKRITHVAIYAGDNKLLHTYGKGGVKYTEFSSYWKSRFVTAKRVF